MLLGAAWVSGHADGLGLGRGALELDHASYGGCTGRSCGRCRAPAFATCWLETQIVKVRATTRRNFSLITTPRVMSQKSFRERRRGQALLGSAQARGRCRSAGKKIAVSSLVAGGERRPILRGCPAPHRNVGLGAALGRKSSRIRSIARCPVGDLSIGLVGNGEVFMMIGGERRNCSYSERGTMKETVNFLIIFLRAS